MKFITLFTIVSILFLSCGDGKSPESVKPTNSSRQLKNEKVIENMSPEGINDYFNGADNLGNALNNCLKNCLSEQDTSSCITEATKRLNVKMNREYLMILDGKGEDEFSLPEVINEVNKAQQAWLRFKEQEMYLIYYHFPDHVTLEQLELGQKYEQKETFEWCNDYSNYGMLKCAIKTSEHYDSLLNDSYKRIRDQLDEKGKESLEKTQLAWIEYRKAETGIWNKISELHDGSMYPTRSAQNGAKIYLQRAMELNYYNILLSKENDTSKVFAELINQTDEQSFDKYDSLLLLTESIPFLNKTIHTADEYVSFDASLHIIGTLMTGKYRGDSLIIGAFSSNCKGIECNVPHFLRFVKSDNKLIYLPLISDPLDHFLFKGFSILTDFNVQSLGLSFEVDDNYFIPGFEYKTEIIDKKTKQLLVLKEVFPTPFFAYEKLDTTGCSVIFHDDILGPVYSKTLQDYKVSENLFYAFRKDSTTLIFDFSIPFNPASPSFFDSIDFSTKNREWKKHQYFYKGSVIMDNKKFIYTNVETNEGKRIYRLANGRNNILNMIDDNNKYMQMGLYFHEQEAAAKDEHAIFFLKNPLIENKYLTYVSNKYLATYATEPIIYLYPTQKIDITVSVKAEGGIYKSDPLIGENGWSVSAEPTGKLTNKLDGNIYPYLFWEGITKPLFIKNTGSVVRKDSVEYFLRKELSHKGLIENEIEDFLKGWLPKFKSFDYYFITFVDQAKIDELFPLEINPKPETIIRVYIDFYGLNVPIEVNNPETHNKITRNGYSVIEWGGFER
jgi:uncharacterized protein YecT (DUF1311 family)